MKHVITIIITAMLAYSMTLSAQEVETFVRSQLAQYPQSRLLDLYKSSFQDFMGAEHLVNDTASARAYLEQELAQCETMELLPWYSEPCGPNGNHIRVSLRAVLEGHISADALLSAFIASANIQSRPTVEQWSTRWRDMMAVIDRMELDRPHYDKDRQFIDEVLNQGKYAISHSTDYREAYSPHYRIIAREIFERDIEPLLPHPCCCH